MRTVSCMCWDYLLWCAIVRPLAKASPIMMWLRLFHPLLSCRLMCSTRLLGCRLRRQFRGLRSVRSGAKGGRVVGCKSRRPRRVNPGQRSLRWQQACHGRRLWRYGSSTIAGRCCVRRLLLLLLGHSTPAWLPALLALLPWPLLPRPAQGVHASVITLAQPDPRNRIPASNMHTPGRRKWLWPLHAQRLRQRSRRPWLRKGWRIVAELQRRDAEQRGMRGDRWWRAGERPRQGGCRSPCRLLPGCERLIRLGGRMRRKPLHCRLLQRHGLLHWRRMQLLPTARRLPARRQQRPVHLPCVTLHLLWQGWAW